MIKVDNTKRYNQLAIELLKRIFNGYYKLDARLPSTREMISEIFGKELIPYCVQCAKIHLHKKTNKMENLWHNVLANLFAHQYKTYSFPKSFIGYRKPRAVSTEQRERARQMMIAKNKAKGD